jgi:hypothetical protein
MKKGEKNIKKKVMATTPSKQIFGLTDMGNVGSVILINQTHPR